MDIIFDYYENEQVLYLLYRPNPYKSDIDYIVTKMKSKTGWSIKHTFFISKDTISLHDEDIDKISNEIRIPIGELSNGFIKINPEITRTKNTFYFSPSMKLTKGLFVAGNNISIILRIDSLIHRDLYIGEGWEQHDGIPEEDYRQLIKTFPTTTELYHYRNYRISLILRNFFPECERYEDDYNKHLARKMNKHKTINTHIIALDNNLEIEFEKFRDIRDLLQNLLEKSIVIDETDWQEIIQRIILLIYPQYILSIRETKIKSTGLDKHDKKPDFLLVDANGFVDVLEIKKPQVQILTENPSYRYNYIPVRELSGTTTQIEKYLFYLNSMTSRDDNVCLQIKNHLPPNSVEPQIVSPRGLLLLGRSNSFVGQKKQDFEVIKRQYKHIADIMTYDDLLQRLNNIIAALQFKIENMNNK